MTTSSKVDGIIDSIRTRILSGEFGEGKLPSFRKLVVEYNTSQETMNKAMQALQAEGLLLSSGAKGVFINHRRMRLPKIIKNFYKFIEQEGLEASEELIGEAEIIVPDESLAKKMLLSKKASVLHRRRRQGTSSTPFRFVDSYYPVSLIPEDEIENIKTDARFAVVEKIKEATGKTIMSIHEELIARLPTAEEQELLKIVRTNPVIEVTFINYTEDKKTVLMYNKMILNANHFLLSYDYEIDYWA